MIINIYLKFHIETLGHNELTNDMIHSNDAQVCLYVINIHELNCHNDTQLSIYVDEVHNESGIRLYMFMRFTINQIHIKPQPILITISVSNYDVIFDAYFCKINIFMTIIHNWISVA